MQKNESAKSAKEIVVTFLESLSNGDLKSARSCVSDNFSGIHPQGSFDSAEAYFRAAEQSQQKYQASYKFDIKKIFTDGNDVCVFNDVIAGSIILACGWYHVEDGKIQSLKLVYDPRPLLQKRQ